MPEYDNVILDVDPSGVATITLNRPEKLNALSDDLRTDLENALREVNPGDAVRVIRIKANGRAFSAGYDLTPGVPGRRAAPSGPWGTQAWELGESRIALDRERLAASVQRWLWFRSYRKPIVAQVHGWCLSGANDFIGQCDIIYAAEDARFGHPAARANGILPTLAAWPFKIGAAKTKELLFTGNTIDGIEAERLGMINHAVPAAELDQATMDFCRHIAKVPMEGLTVHKQATNRWFELAGYKLATEETADFDAIWHEAPAFKEFGRMSSELGLKTALAWRDDPFHDGRSAVART